MGSRTHQLQVNQEISITNSGTGTEMSVFLLLVTVFRQELKVGHREPATGVTFGGR